MDKHPSSRHSVLSGRLTDRAQNHVGYDLPQILQMERVPMNTRQIVTLIISLLIAAACGPTPSPTPSVIAAETPSVTSCKFDFEQEQVLVIGIRTLIVRQFLPNSCGRERQKKMEVISSSQLGKSSRQRSTGPISERVNSVGR